MLDTILATQSQVSKNAFRINPLVTIGIPIFVLTTTRYDGRQKVATFSSKELCLRYVETISDDIEDYTIQETILDQYI